MIGGYMKYFRVDDEKILWTLSYQNMAMYLASIPTYETSDLDKDSRKDKEEKVDGFDSIAGWLLK